MPELYSNCVILEFASPITRAQLDVIKNEINMAKYRNHILLPELREIVCAEREGNVVVPSIAADEC